MTSAADTIATVATEESAVRKAFRRLVPLLMVFYILAYVDRVNIGFAALSMNADLGLTATMFGIANTAFYVMFSLFEVPSNMMLQRYGARIWIPRIMITWGLASIATMFAVGPLSLYSLRALVGLAEAGLLPGVIYYLSQWFPQAFRARANAIYLAALPLALTIGAPISGLILQMDGWLGLQGWQWLFILEGIPSVLMGVAAFFLLPERPANARWLNQAEKTALQNRVDAENAAKMQGAGPQPHILREILGGRIVILAVSYFCLLASLNTLGLWVPLMVRELLGGTDRLVLVGFVSAIPPLVSVFAMQAFSLHADRKQERVWHTIFGFSVAAAGWVVTATAAGVPAVAIVGLCLTSMGGYSAMTTFWAMASQILSHRGQAVGIAAISTVGTVASMVSPTIIGVLRDATGSFIVGMWYAMVLLTLAALLMIALALSPHGIGKIRKP